MPAAPLTFGSLFAGIGGMDLGLERAGLVCRWQLEKDPDCQTILAARWPGVKRHGDITTTAGSDLEPVDVLAGGFPCQDLSHAGKRAGIEGDRSGLWFEFARLIGELRPRYVLIENVSGLLVHDAMRRVVGELARLGYVGCWRSLRASEFGASHQRKRVFIIAVRTMADGAPGGRRELRQSPGSDGLTDGSNAQLANSARDLGRRQSFGLQGSAVPSGPGTGGREILANSSSTRCDGVAREEQRVFGQPLLPTRFGDGRAAVEHSARDEQQGREGEGGRVWRRGVCAAGEPLAEPPEFLWRFRCNHCRLTFDAARDAAGMLTAVPCPGCGSEDRCLTYELGNADDARLEGRGLRECGRADERAAGQTGDAVADPTNYGPAIGEGSDSVRSDILPTKQKVGCGRENRAGEPERCSGDIPEFAPGPSDPQWPGIIRERPDLAPAITTFPAARTIARSLARERAACFPKRGRRRLRKELALGIALALSEGIAWEDAAVLQIRGMADGVSSGAHGALSERLAVASAKEWLGGLRNLGALTAAMRNRTKRLGRLGNAVFPACAEWLGRRLVEYDLRTNGLLQG